MAGGVTIHKFMWHLLCSLLIYTMNIITYNTPLHAQTHSRKMKNKLQETHIVTYEFYAVILYFLIGRQ